MNYFSIRALARPMARVSGSVGEDNVYGNNTKDPGRSFATPTTINTNASRGTYLYCSWALRQSQADTILGSKETLELEVLPEKHK